MVIEKIYYYYYFLLLLLLHLKNWIIIKNVSVEKIEWTNFSVV